MYSTGRLRWIRDLECGLLEYNVKREYGERPRSYALGTPTGSSVKGVKQ